MTEIHLNWGGIMVTLSEIHLAKSLLGELSYMRDW